MGFVDDGLEFLLGQIAVPQIVMAIEGALSAGHARLEEIGTVAKVSAGRTADVPGPVAVPLRISGDDPRLHPVMVASGRQHETTGNEPGTGKLSRRDEIAQRAHFLHEVPAERRHPIHIAQRRKTRFEQDPGILGGIEQHLGRRADDVGEFDLVVVAVVRRREVDVQVHHARHQDAIAAIDYAGPAGAAIAALAVDPGYASLLDQDLGIGDRFASIPVDQQAALQNQRFRHRPPLHVVAVTAP